MTQQMRLPRLGELTENAVIISWLCKVGDVIEIGQHIAEVETDKVELELESTVAGKVSRILVEAGQEVDVGTPLFEVEP